MRLSDFFATHPVFRVEEAVEFLEEHGTANPSTRRELLAYHRRQGHILSVRRGLYVVVPPGATPETCPVDPFLIAAKITGDAVVAYHTALAFYGKTYSVFDRYYYLAARRSPPLTFRSYGFQVVLFPKRLRSHRQEIVYVETHERLGVPVYVTALERTLVDVLDRPDLGGGWEEVWRSLSSIEYVDPDKVVDYALRLDNATTAAKVGFFLERHRDMFMIEDAHLRPLHDHRPRNPHYMVRGERKSGRYVSEWNLVVPQDVFNESWAEVP